MPKIIRFPTAERRDLPRWAKNAGADWTVKFKSGKRPSLAKAAKAKAAQEPTAPNGDDMDERMTPSIPHYWDLMVIREILGWPDSGRTYATQEERKVAETKAMAAQRRIIQNFSSRYEEMSKKCKQLEAEVRKLRGSSATSGSDSRSRKT